MLVRKSGAFGSCPFLLGVPDGDSEEGGGPLTGGQQQVPKAPGRNDKEAGSGAPPKRFFSFMIG